MRALWNEAWSQPDCHNESSRLVRLGDTAQYHRAVSRKNRTGRFCGFIKDNDLAQRSSIIFLFALCAMFFPSHSNRYDFSNLEHSREKKYREVNQFFALIVCYCREIPQRRPTLGRRSRHEAHLLGTSLGIRETRDATRRRILRIGKNVRVGNQRAGSVSNGETFPRR